MRVDRSLQISEKSRKLRCGEGRELKVLRNIKVGPSFPKVLSRLAVQCPSCSGAWKTAKGGGDGTANEGIQCVPLLWRLIQVRTNLYVDTLTGTFIILTKAVKTPLSSV